MKENATTISGISHVPIGTLAKYPTSDLYQSLEQISQQLEQLKITREWLLSAISLKYEEQIRAKRLRCEKDTGIIHLEDGDFRITNEIPKKVEWNQEKLAKIAADIAIGGGTVSDYVDTWYNVPEGRYNGWSSSMKNIFDPARTLRLGKPVFKLIKLDEEAGL